MASVTYGKYVAGLRDLKITNLAGTTQEDLDAAMQATFTPEWDHVKFTGDDSNKASRTFLRGGVLEVSAGAISSAAIAIVTGKSLTTAGSSPNETTTLQLDAGDNMPYFKVYGKSLDDGDGGVQLLFYKVKLSEGLVMTLQDGEIYTNGFTCEVYDDGSNGIVKQIQEETDSAVPAS